MIPVLLTDENIPYEHAYDHFSYVDKWSRDSCKSYKGFEITDVSDVSGKYDLIAEYLFEVESDVTLFKLRWA